MVFYIVRSRLIGHRLQVGRTMTGSICFWQATLLLTLERSRAGAIRNDGHVVDYHHVIHTLTSGTA